MRQAQAITSYLKDEILQGDSSVEITPQLNLLECGILDSLTLLRLVQFIQAQFQVKVEGADMVPDNFSSIEGMVALIAKKA